jgi:type III restriction enzyme
LYTLESKLSLSTVDLPTRVENAPIVGESSIHTLDDLKNRREQEVAFLLAKLVLEKYFRQDGAQSAERSVTHQFDAEVQAWLFPQVLSIAKRWLQECVTCKDNTFSATAASPRLRARGGGSDLSRHCSLAIRRNDFAAHPSSL